MLQIDAALRLAASCRVMPFKMTTFELGIEIKIDGEISFRHNARVIGLLQLP
ncbi:MAG: hypothetical protein J2P23_09035 [Microlunatus sp.]|nr:hypothetical protein [Microlunatus sp.]